MGVLIWLLTIARSVTGPVDADQGFGLSLNRATCRFTVSLISGVNRPCLQEALVRRAPIQKSVPFTIDPRPLREEFDTSYAGRGTFSFPILFAVFGVRQQPQNEHLLPVEMDRHIQAELIPANVEHDHRPPTGHFDDIGA